MGNSDNIKWGYFDIIHTNSSGYSIQKTVAKTSDNTLYVPIATSMYMEEYKLEDLIDFVLKESIYFNTLPLSNRLAHPSMLWYLENENCLAINYPSVITARLKKTVTQMAFEPTRIPDVNTKGLYYNMMGINPGHNTDIQDAFATTGERHSETFCLIKCLISSSYMDYRTFCKAKDSSGNDVYLINWDSPVDKPNIDPNAFIDCNMGPIFHLDTNKECNHQFCTHYMSTQQGIGTGTREPDQTSNYGVYPPYMVFGKKTGNTGELAVSVQARGTFMYLKNSSAENLMYFMKYDANNAIQVCRNGTWATHIHFNPKIGGIKINPVPIANKKFTLYYFGNPADNTKPLLFHSAFIDLENNITRYEMITAAEASVVKFLEEVENPLIVKKFEGDITYVSPIADPFSIPSGKMFRFLMLTTGSLHGKKLWKYQSADPNDFLTIYQSGSLYHGFTNPNNLQLTTGDLFEIREEILMTICSFGPCGESETDPVKATTINTGYRHIYMAIKADPSKEFGGQTTSENYNYSQECIFGPYRSFNVAQNGHDFYLVKCLDLNKLETEFGYEVSIKLISKNIADVIAAYDINKTEIRSPSGATHVMTLFCEKTKILKIESHNNGLYYILGTQTSNKLHTSSNYLSNHKWYLDFGNDDFWGAEVKFDLTERQDKLFIVGLTRPVSLEVYFRKA